MSYNVKIPKKWPDGQESTAVENWAWDEIHAGRVADFNIRYEEELDPKKRIGWGISKKDRRLSATFLVTVLTDERFQSATPYQGVRIVGARFDEPIDLESARLKRLLWLDQCWLKKKLNLIDLHIDGHISLEGSRLSGPADFTLAVIGGSFNFTGARIEKSLDLAGAKITGQLSLEGSSFGGKLDMNSIKVGRSLVMGGGATFGEVVLAGADITGQLSMGGSIFEGALSLASIRIGHDLIARSTVFPQDHKVILVFARIGSNLDLSDATVSEMDLTGTIISGELRLGSATRHQPTNWVGGSIMNLRNTTVGALQDADSNHEIDCWPEHLKFEGFRCIRLGGWGGDGGADIEKRPSEWFISWLERGEGFSPQPYEFLAKLLRESGYPSKAGDILYAGRECARAKAWQNTEENPREYWRSIGLTLLKITIGYGLGIRYFWALWWVLGITLVGFGVLSSQYPATDQNTFTLLWASFDWLLPIVGLDESHKLLFQKNALSNVASGYFYFHKMIGYILASFLVAGLAGLTQKN